MNVKREERELERIFEEEIRKEGIKKGKLQIMMQINRKRKKKMKKVEEIMEMEKKKMKEEIKKLKRRGWVEIIVNKEERRERILKMKEEGKEVIEYEVKIWKEKNEKIEERIEGGKGDEMRNDIIMI